MIIITMTSTSDEENVTNSDVMEHANSPDRPVSPPEPSWKPEVSRSHLHDHNYARPVRPPAKIITAQKSNLSLPPHLKIDASGGDEDDTRDEISKPSSILREELLKRKRQVIDAAAVVVECQKLQAELAVAEKETISLKAIVEQEVAKKTDLQLQFDRFRTSATNVCCGVTVFIDEFRRLFKQWCIASDIRVRDQAQFYSGLDCVSALVEDKFKVWLEDGIVTRAELDRSTESITELVKLSMNSVSKTPFAEEDEEDQNLAAASAPEKKGMEIISQQRKLPDAQTEKDVADKNKEVNVAEVVQNKTGQVETEKHGEAKNNNCVIQHKQALQCVCGMTCKTMSGLKLHIHNRNAVICRRSLLAVKQKKKLEEAVEKNLKKTAVDLVTHCSNPDIIIMESPNVSASSPRNKTNTCPAGKKVKKSTAVKNTPNNRRYESRAAAALSFTTTPSSCSPSSPIKAQQELPSCSSTTSTLSLSSGIKSEKPLEESIPKKDQSSKASTTSGVQQKSEKIKVSRVSHKVNLLKPLECQCGYKAAYKYVLNRHIKYHTAGRKFSCAICPRFFVNQCYLDKHYWAIHKIKQPIIAIVRLKESEIIKQTKSLPTKKTETEKTEISKPIPSKAIAFRTLRILKKRRNASRRKRKLLRITAKERLSCQFCHRRFPHLRDLVCHMARKIHGGEPFINHQSTAKRVVKNCIDKTLINGVAGGSKTPLLTPTATTTPHSSTGSPSSPRSKSTPRRSTRLTKPTTSSTLSFNSLHDENEKHVNVETKVHGERCVCDQECDKKKFKKGSSPHYCTICGFVFVCVDFLRTHLLEMHHITCKIPSATNSKINRNIFKTQEMDQTNERNSIPIPPKPSGRKRQRKSKPIHRPRLTTEKEDNVEKPKVNTTIHYPQVKGRGVASSCQCSCGKVYAGRRTLLTHISEQRLGKVFKCPVCGLGFAKSYNLSVHIGRVHQEQQAKVKKCSSRVYAKTFKNSSDRFRHRVK